MIGLMMLLILFIGNFMIDDLIEQPKTNKKLCIMSAYNTSSWDLDIHNKIDIKNEKNIVLESITINSMIMRFYEIPSVETYGIISAYIWDTEKREIVEHIKDLPDLPKKNLVKAKQLLEIDKKINYLQQLKENFLSS